MKKIIIFIAVFLASIIIFEVQTTGALSHTSSMTGQEIITELNKSRDNLKKNHSSGESYTQKIDVYFTRINNNSVKLHSLVTRIEAAETKLADTSENKELLLLLDYIKYKSIHALYVLENKNISAGSLSDEEVVAAINNIHKKIEADFIGGINSPEDAIGITLMINEKYGETWTLGYPNYDTLGIIKRENVDVYGNEFFIVVLKDGKQYSHQVLGYIEKSDTQKMAVVIWNYVQKSSQYPESLFLDPNTGNFIKNGSVFNIK